MERNTNVKVALRIRPLSGKERLNGSTECLDAIESTSSEEISRVVIGTYTFCFDEIHPTNIEQDEVFQKNMFSIINNVVEGYNCTVIAYGQTGSGKTYTMGTGIENIESFYDQGILPRTIKTVFEKIEEIQKEENEDISFSAYMSFIEIYNEDIVDLLISKSVNGITNKTRGLSIREDKEGEIHIPGITEEKVSSTKDVLELLQNGALNRTTGSTEMNAVSSRSHAIFTLTIRYTQPKKDSTEQKRIVSKLHFVDLAGSERMKKTQAVGKRAKESISINTGLLALGNVISALGDESRKATHVPYRDSKITRLLQDSLGGNCQTVMIACVSPATENYAETLNTLQYANRAKNIRNSAVINQEGKDSVFEVIQLKKQISSLKKEIMLLKRNTSKTLPEKEKIYSRYKGKQKTVSIDGRSSLVMQRRMEIVTQSRESMHRLNQCLREKNITDNELVDVFKIDENIREDLHQCLEEVLNENAGLKDKYEEKIRQLHTVISQINKERDLALSRVKTNVLPTNLTRKRHEEIIKNMGKEIKLLKIQQQAKNKTVEIKENFLIKKNETDSDLKWKKGFEFQKKIIQRKTEQFSIAKTKIMSLLTLLKKRRVTISTDMDLNSPGWKKLQLTTEKISNTETKMDLEEIKKEETENLFDGGIQKNNSFLSSFKRRISPSSHKRKDTAAVIADKASLFFANEEQK